ncbi:MAG: DUF5615 family PIN-like protein [Cyanobacteria bacterium J06621_11]
MLILLDENLLSKKLKKALSELGHTVKNVEDMGWRGIKDTALLELAESKSFDVFVTADKNIPYQQNIKSIALRLVILNTKSTRPDYLLPLIYKIGQRLRQLEIGSVTLINDAQEIEIFDN